MKTRTTLIEFRICLRLVMLWVFCFMHRPGMTQGADTLRQLLLQGDTLGYINYVVNDAYDNRESYAQDTLYAYLEKAEALALQTNNMTDYLWVKYRKIGFYFVETVEHPAIKKDLLDFIHELEQLPPNPKYLTVLGHAYSMLSDFKTLSVDSSIYYIQKSVDLAPIIKDTFLLILNLEDLAKISRARGDWKNCIKYGEKGIAVIQTQPYLHQYLYNYQCFVGCLVEMKKYDQVEPYLDFLWEKFLEIDWEKEYYGLLDLCRDGSFIYEKLGKYKRALALRKIYQKIYESQYRQKLIQELDQVRRSLETQEKENQILSLELQNRRSNRQQNQLVLFLGILIVGILALVAFFRQKQQFLAKEAQQLKVLDEAKTTLFTNITHEFRTPLTVISGMADQLLNEPRQWLEEGVRTIKRNSQQLLLLVNQMLDLSKLEMKTLSVTLIQDDLVDYIRYLNESFSAFAKTKNINIQFSPKVDELLTDFDPAKLETIYSNLLSNAIKFTPEGGQVSILLDQKKNSHGQSGYTLKVKDTGVGIPKDRLAYIFDRFYQVDDSPTRQAEGTGIGLTLAKQMVELLGGQIEVESEPNKGSTFSVWLPISQLAPVGQAVDQIAPKDLLPVQPAAIENILPSLPTSSAELPLALLIEDNHDVLNYLKRCLAGKYRLEMAHNGQIGIEKGIKLVPDIIISDIMMPIKDGYELCDTLKRDQRTSHIPIILLTAKADQASRLTGLRRGADAYLVKPFDQTELEVRLEKLLETRQQLKEKYLKATITEVVVREDEDAEWRFLKKIENIVLDNLANEEFKVEPDLCKALMMSRSQLYRKLKALTNHSPSDYIRRIRMNKAKHLLHHSELSIGSIATQVGFKDFSHFSRTYSKIYGTLPSETRK